ncbi:MAG: cobalt ECF transporter T component CbiQ [Lachnospiraceae bacterium]|nr:cobalt ECF transporter T component CbiQ [Lachnospiraceae bacterium]
MSKIDNAIIKLYKISDEASKDTWINNIFPLFKMILTCFYIIMVTSISKYQMDILISMGIYIMVLFIAGNISIKDCFFRLRIVLPLVCIMGIFNIFFDKNVLFYVGDLPVTGGIISFLLLMIKGIFTLLAVYLLIITTTIEKICTSLSHIHCPKIIITLFLLIYRYIGLLMEETNRMLQAYRLRAPGQKGIKINVWGSFVGMLLLRTFDRAERVNESMSLRGFTGEFRNWDRFYISWKDWAYFLIFLGVIVLFRYFHVFQLVGRIIDHFMPLAG